MKNFLKTTYKVSGLKYIFILLGLQSGVGYIVNIIKNITLLNKTKISKDEKERAIGFLRESFCNNLENKKEKLKDGLDENSKKVVDTIVNRYLFMSTHEFNPPFLKQEVVDQKIVRIFMLNVDKSYQLSLAQYESNVFYYHCGLKIFDNIIMDKIKNYLKGKDVIDAGAFTGDSALMFLKEYPLNRVFAFEPESTNYDLLQKTIAINKDIKIISVKKGLGDISNEKVSITSIGSSSMITDNVGNISGEIIEITTIDDFVNKNQDASIGIIKMDIEGYEFKAIKGSVATIQKYQPILLISIYHNPIDFFEIKPYLEGLNIGYKFSIIKANPDNLVYETMLIGIPKKIYE